MKKNLKIQLREKITNLNYLPRWIILIIDFTIIIACLFFTDFLLSKMNKALYFHGYFVEALSLYFGTNLFCFYFFKSYSGIIRHSSIQDTFKIFKVQVVTLLTLLFINNAYFFNFVKYFGNAGLVINFIFCFTLLVLFRVFVKLTFEYYFSTVSSRKDEIRVLVYGTDTNSISVVNSIQTNKTQKYKVVGFIDHRYGNTNKLLLALPIFSNKSRIPALLRVNNCQGIILTDASLTIIEKTKIVNDCLEFNFKVFTVPKISNLENGQEVSNRIKHFDINDLLERDSIIINNHKIAEQHEATCVLVTGAAGSIGSEIVRQLYKFSPKKIILLDQAESPLNDLTLEIEKIFTNQIELLPLIGDVRNYDYIDTVLKEHKPDIIYHAAAYKHVPLMEINPKQAIQTNIIGTKTVAALAIKYQVKKFVLVSTDKAVNPSSVMGASKRIAELTVQYLNQLSFKNKDFHTEFIITRFGNVLGSNGSVVPLFTRQINEGGPVTLTHPDIIRYFMTIPEACQLVLEAGIMGSGGEIFIFDMGEPVRIYDLAVKMIKLAGYQPNKDIEIKVTGLRPGEKLYEELLNDKAKTKETYHKKIMISIDHETNLEEIYQQILQLIENYLKNNDEEVVTQMKEIVPEFISLNSFYKN
ncbi:polysaccharide biosynthesis protein [Flavobacterium branchiophilum NBRC 15030 = ATCC 35035]|uniref:FlaA1/EpsC-like NDP-sugar epimerase n=1 Tax=Flavobacterium branchiophilum TaxID=55197 RepID=A0A543G7N0_9FLAO|nr:nucleoside-diphosphate sugar epimerase/dehydratase [Flavobacterium branchiophilum]OXA76007.1 polysaccharide biosynthesis protein [Flavobacterium branchiophilum NBRC 15030 = ATCC 35035]TQM42095.1 FlaA1/EpsC-like NDP-sugar epimerase [Flavobacterium branchiophilum]GEM53868.1 polysaccharide biosynthesis protein CapD [Flavobacterium branchiophilum NBRC 15030 = ATCC 35035]